MNENTEALRAHLLLLLRTSEPVDASLMRFVGSLTDFELVEQIEMVEETQCAVLAALRARGDAIRIH